MTDSKKHDEGGNQKGAVAVVSRDEKFLVIQRADHIRAGGQFCFPGGGIEAGESSRDAVVRELEEELGVVIQPVKEVWQCTTSWAVDLSWWLAELEAGFKFVPEPSEVQWVGWWSLDEMKSESRMLSSAHEFISGVEKGEIRLA